MRDRIQNYVFTPAPGGSGTIQVQGYVELADVLVITNVTQNIIIYQFSDPAKGAAVTYIPTTTTNYPQSQNGVTTITLDYNTSGMSANDDLQIYVETREVIMRPWHFGTDAIERMRVAQPQSLIDADFEYGLQNTKWQSLSLNNNMPAIYEQPGADLTLNTRGYVTLISSTNSITSAADTSFALANQYEGIADPGWVDDEYALLVNTTNVRPSVASITANVSGAQQRTMQFTGNAQPFTAGDIVAIYKVEPELSESTITQAITSGATVLANIAGSNAFANGGFVTVETATAGIFEIMAITSGAGSGNLTVERRIANTNPTSVNINAGAAVRALGNIEIGNVQSIGNTTTMTINRGWYNTTPLDFITTGSIVQKLWQDRSNGATGNLEIVKLTTASTQPGGAVTAVRGAAGTTAIPGAIGAGGLVLHMTGIFNAGSANVAEIGISSTAHAVTTSGYISTQNHNHPDSEGLYFAETAETNNIFYYPKKSNGLAIGYPLNRYDTALRKAAAYTGASIPFTSIVSDGLTPSTITVTTPYAHGLQPGTPLLVDLTAGTNLAHGSGAFPILRTATATTFTYQGKPGAAVSGSLVGTIVIKPNSYFLHRPFDGGVAMTSGSPHHGALSARQTKKYFRYQSGKGMFFTSGTLFAPTFDIATVTASNVNVYGTITISTEQNHQLQVGAVVRVSGIDTTGYNGTYRVTSITSDRSFTTQIYQTLGSTSPAFAPQPRINVTGWYGGAVRAGLFDDQNGLFWEFDGEKLNVVRRSATYQIAGLVSVQAQSNLVTGDGTCRLQDQLRIGDSVVLRGMTHTVTSILDQNSMTVVPEYRGTSNESRIKCLLVQELRVPQEQFNIDIMDGTGPSGYIIDPAKMQMIMIQYTWYGAGFIEFGVRGPNGRMILAHRMRNNNVNDEAYMRSGNLPCRYEASSSGALTKLYGNITASQTTMQIQDGTFFPSNVSVQYPAYISVDNEIVAYTTITKNAYGVGNTVANLSLVARGGVGSQLTQWIEGSSQTFQQGANVSHTTGSGVYVLGCTAAPTLTHWGSAVVLDGGYDQDKGFSFTFVRNNVALPVTEGGKTTLFLMRLAPSVSNTVIGLIGTRDLVNRAALDLNNLIVNITGGRYLIEGILNPTNVDLNTSTFVNLNNVASGNQPSFSQFSTNIQFAGTTIGGILPSAATYTGTGIAKGGLRTNNFTYFGTARSAGVTGTQTWWGNNVPVTTSTGTGAGAFVSIRATAPQAGGTYTVQYAIVTNPGGGYQATNNVRVLGTSLSSGTTFGATTANDLILNVTAPGSDAQFANNVVLSTVTGNGAGANISLRLAQNLNASLTNYAQRAVTYTVNNTGDGYVVGDQLRVLGNLITGGGTSTTNDLTMTLTSVSGSVTGGERLFAVPVNSNNSGLLDLTNVKQLGSSAIPGNGVYPDGPEILAITITCLSTQVTQHYADVQLAFTESQA